MHKNIIYDDCFDSIEIIDKFFQVRFFVLANFLVWAATE